MSKKIIIREIIERFYYWAYMSIEYVFGKSDPEISAVTGTALAIQGYVVGFLAFVLKEKFYIIVFSEIRIGILIAISFFLITGVMLYVICYRKEAYKKIIKKYKDISRKERYFGFIFYWMFVLGSGIFAITALFVNYKH